MEEYAGEADNLLTIDPVGVGSDEMFIGRAGYLSGCLWLQRKLGRNVEKLQEFSEKLRVIFKNTI